MAFAASGAGRAAPYAETAAAVIWPFVDGIDRDALVRTCVEAYATFRHDAVCPLVQLSDDTWLLELFHGPTLAFKDVALQLVGRLMDDELGRRGERTSIVVATSGDTGSAAIEACRGRANLEIFVLHPAGRVSEVQRRQMTTVLEPNVHNIALEGTFDDCQDMVKALFADAAFREEHRLGALELDQLGPRRRAGRLLRDRSDLTRRERGTAGVVRRAERQLRQRVLGMGREADGRADPPAHHRVEPQRHPHSGRQRRTDGDHRRRTDDEPQHGHPDLVELRARAVRAERTRWRAHH